VAKRDYYEVLGVADDVETGEIRQAFRRLAKRWHPDRNPDQSAAATERFREIVEAWTVLGNPARRRRYDFETGRPPRPLPRAAEPAPPPPPRAARDADEEPEPPGPEAELVEAFEAIRRRQGRLAADREAFYGCLLLVAALTSPCWVPTIIGIGWHVYNFLASRFAP
jgi:curved DNA-binding protein CbpA